MSSEAVAIMKTAPIKKRRIGVCITGCCLLTFGVISGLTWDTTLTSFVYKTITLRPESKVYQYWKSPPLDINLDIYLFNWTNPKDFNNPDSKPILQQVGPYRFQEIPDKVDIQWHPENYTVSYRRKSFYKFKPSESAGSLSDNIITINPVAVSAATKTRGWNQVRRGIIDFVLKYYNDEISVTKTVDELLFTGYTDLLLDFVNTLPTLLSDIEVPFDKFGYCYMRNESSVLTGTYNVFTGADDISKIGQMNTWNYKKQTNKFDSYCGMINGSAGEFQPPNLKINETLNIFVAEMCRSMPLEYVETVEVEGVKGYKYIAGLRAIDNGTLYPENKCFCGGRCVPSGVMNVSSCWFDAPVFMSYPHFYNADPYYVDALVGMQPKQKDHELYVVLEPTTGLALEVAARFQVNLMLEPLSYLNLFKKTPHIFFPIMWFEERVRITPELAGDFQRLPLLLWFGKCIAATSIFIGLVTLAWNHNKEQSFQHHQQCMDFTNDNVSNDMDDHSSKDDNSNETDIEQNEPAIVESVATSESTDQNIVVDKQRLKLLYLQSNSFDSGFLNMDACSHTSSSTDDEIAKTKGGG